MCNFYCYFIYLFNFLVIFLILQEKRLQFQSKVDAMKEKVANKRQEILDKSRGIITEWEDKSREFIGNFMDMFSRDGRLVRGRELKMEKK